MHILNFPLSFNQEIDEVIKSQIVWCCEFLLERLSDIEAVVLIGSLSRGQGVGVIREDGCVRFYSDIEFMVVVSEGIDFRAARERLQNFGKEASLRLEERGFKCEVTFGIGRRRDLRRYKPRIFTYEMRRFGKVVWGDKGVLSEIPEMKGSDIPREDAIRLLFNRMIEQLGNYERIDQEDALYHIAKGYVDIAKSYLLFNGRYEWDYLRIAKAVDIDGLGEKVRYWAKLRSDFNVGSFNKGEILKEWRELRNWFGRVWRRESNIFLGNGEFVEDVVELAKGYLRQQKVMDRLKGWVKLWLREISKTAVAQGFSPANARLKPRATTKVRCTFVPLLKGSPELLIGLAGAMVYLSMFEEEERVFSFAKSCLPVRFKELGDLKQEVVHNWEVFVKEG